MSVSPSKKRHIKRTILIADDHLLLLETLKLAIDSGDFEATICQSRNDALKKLESDKDSFELVLLDVHMPDMNGMKSVVEVVKTAAPIPVVLLSGGISNTFAVEGLKNGVRGYIPKSTKLSDLNNIIKVIVSGGTFFPASTFVQKSDESISFGLSPREKIICPLLSKGLSNKEISHKLNISESSVKMHIRAIFRKVGASNRTQVATLLNETALE